MEIRPAQWVTIALAATMTGLTVIAIRRKIGRGVWLEGRNWRKADGGIYIDMREYEKWVEKAPASKRADSQ